MNIKKICVIGGGSFGTAIANIAATNSAQVVLWMRSEKQCEAIIKTRINERYLPGYRLHDDLTITTDLQSACRDADLVFVAVPSKVFRVVMTEAMRYITSGVPLISLTKGIEHGSFKLMSQILQELAPGHDVGVLSGPNLAKEIAQNQLTATVVASYNPILRKNVQAILDTPLFSVYANPDTFGVELAGALKNIYAIVSGMAVALGMGENTRAMIITRSLAEMSRFAQGMGANPLTFIGLAGVGDLIVTCSSVLSRNYKVGFEIGQGRSLVQAIKNTGETAEGINTLKMVKEKADEVGVNMPIVNALYETLFEGGKASDIAAKLMKVAHADDVEYMLGG